MTDLAEDSFIFIAPAAQDNREGGGGGVIIDFDIVDTAATTSHAGGVNVMFSDGSVRSVKTSITGFDDIDLAQHQDGERHSSALIEEDRATADRTGGEYQYDFQDWVVIY